MLPTSLGSYPVAIALETEVGSSIFLSAVLANIFD